MLGLRGEFRRGRLVSIDADNAADASFLRQYLARDRGAGRLGEVALVDASSRIGAAGRIYRTTLLDENAASHIAFGFGFCDCRVPGAARPNQSKIHTDVMVGTRTMNVIGHSTTGREVTIIDAGLCVI